MARRVARILKAIHGEHFGGEKGAKFSITWDELREMAGGLPLTEAFFYAGAAAHLAETPLSDDQR